MFNSIINTIDTSIEELARAKSVISRMNNFMASVSEKFNITQEEVMALWNAEGDAPAIQFTAPIVPSGEKCAYILPSKNRRCKRNSRINGYCTAHSKKVVSPVKVSTRTLKPVTPPPAPAPVTVVEEEDQCVFMKPGAGKSFKRCTRSVKRDGLCELHCEHEHFFMTRTYEHKEGPAPGPLAVKTSIIEGSMMIGGTKSPTVTVTRELAYIARAPENLVIFQKYGGKDMFEKCELKIDDVKELVSAGFPVCPKILKKFNVTTNIYPIIIKVEEKFTSNLRPYRDDFLIHQESGYIVYKKNRQPVIVARLYNGMEMPLEPEDYVMGRNCNIRVQAWDIWNGADISTMELKERYNEVQPRLFTRGNVYISKAKKHNYIFKDGDFYLDSIGNKELTPADIDRLEKKGYGISERLRRAATVPT